MASKTLTATHIFHGPTDSPTTLPHHEKRSETTEISQLHLTDNSIKQIVAGATEAAQISFRKLYEDEADAV
ncbi:hydrolase [Cardiosporidium cionae]|uniref:Hydrolase n=1 Tax=Cardiosporidium cionae TaxID=476202 RepID=A0ABQ7J3W7_9APIC|nr:hydrolase [Cardiosporidium cionae]|eukprot:KAF8817798.1 hydrolase [Cardiosporidium cionae]